MEQPNGVTQVNPNPNPENLEPADGGGVDANGQQITTVDQPEKLYAGRFKTPEELEEHYKLSSTEGQRLAQEVKRLQALVRTADVTKTDTSQPQSKQGGYDSFFDKDTSEAIKWYIRNHITEFAQSQKSEESYRKQVADSWEDTKKEYPELSNPQSELFQLADKILFERSLATRSEDGTLTLATPYAYRIAVDAAYAQLQKQGPARQAAAAKKNQAVSVSGRATGGYVPTGRLTEEQYNKLSDEQKDAYDAWSVQNKLNNNRR
jgi:hypothetical protein